MSHPPSPPWPWFGGLIAPPLPSPSCRIRGCPSTRSPLAGVLGQALPVCRLWESVSQQNRPCRLGARHGDELSETFRCFASCLWPGADPHSASRARSGLWGSPGPVSPPEKRFKPYSWLLFPFPLQPALNSRSISFVFHPGSALCPALHQPWGDITVPDRVGWWQGHVLSPDGEMQAGRDLRSRSGLLWALRAPPF